MAIASFTLPDHETHQHLCYGLTCEQYEALIAESAGQCQTCPCPSSASTRGKLAIDHDHKVGDWAVRGLLCHRCNNILAKHEADPPDWSQAYLADPWYMRMLRDLNLDAHPPEHDQWTLFSGYPIGPQVRDFRGRVWCHEGGTWGTSGNNHAYSWKALLYYVGPHNLSPHFIEGAGLITAEEAYEILAARRRTRDAENAAERRGLSAILDGQWGAI